MKKPRHISIMKQPFIIALVATSAYLFGTVIAGANSEESRSDNLEFIVSTPEPPPVELEHYQNGDRVIFHRTGTFGNHRYNRTTLYEYKDNSGDSGTSIGPWLKISNAVSREACGVGCEEYDEEQVIQ